MIKLVDIICITLCLNHEDFSGHIDEHIQSKEAKTFITLSNKGAFPRIRKEELLKVQIWGLDSHKRIRYGIYSYKRDRKKAFKLLKEKIFLEFNKREKYYREMARSLKSSDSFNEYIDWINK